MRHSGTRLSRIALDLQRPQKILDAIDARLQNRSQPTTRGSYIKPRDELEQWLTQCWCTALRQHRISIFDDFFELGGNSLQATQIIAQARSHFSVDVSLNALFEEPTIAGLADIVRAAAQLASDSDSTILQHTADDAIHGVSFAQQRLFFLHGWDGGGATYNIPLAFRIKGEFHPETLQQCLDTLAHRHPALRTRFAVSENEIGAIIDEDSAPLIDIRDRRGESTPNTLQNTLIQQEAAKPFDLENGPLMRVTVLLLSGQETLLLLTLHHIISDGWSLGVLLQELSALYNARILNKPAMLPDLPFQYADFAAWQKQWLSGDIQVGQLDYWKSVLADLPPPLTLPVDHQRPATRSARGDIARFSLVSELRDQLEMACRDQRATLFMGLMAAWFVLLHRFSQQDDIVVGTPIANRNHAGTEGMLGFFVNTLALRADLSHNPVFADLLEHVRSITLQAFEHQDIPFEKVVTELDLERDLSRTPVFQVMLVYQNAQSDSLALTGTSITPLTTHSGTSKFDLILEVVETGTGLDLNWEYDSALFDRETIELFQHAWQTLLKSLPQQWHQPVSALTIGETDEPSLPPADTSVDRVSTNIIELFEQQAAATPANVATVFDGQNTHYAQLNKQANQLARHLQTLGVTHGDRIGLCLPRTSQLIVGILGILKTGAAYVPLDPTYPAERIRYMLDDSGAGIVVTDIDNNTSLPSAEKVIVCLNRDAQSIQQQSDDNLSVAIDADLIAYIIYTSGSTGRPKGVAIPHANVTRLFHSTDAWFGFNQDDVWTLFHSYAFDFTVWEIWGALFYGGRLIIVPFEVTRTPDAFHALLIEHCVTVLNQTPTAFAQLVRHDSASSSDPQMLALRYVIFGGEALDFQTLRPWFDRHGDQTPRLINMYGITETTVHVTYRPLSLRDLDSGTRSDIGIPIPDLQCYVLDAYGQKVPTGVAGELHVGGAGLAQGYLNQPNLTAQRFIPNPWASQPGERLYRTGDLVRKLRNGGLDYLGRIDQQVQLRGFRIELGEIESALSTHPKIQESVVLVVDESGHAPQLVAWLVADQTIPVEDIRDWLGNTLPLYMIPAAFVFVDSFALTPNGKLDKAVLPKPQTRTIGSTDTYVAPSTPTEQTLTEIWQDVLSIERVGIHDSFFALGGDSIKSIPVIARARKQGLSLSLLQLFKDPDIQSLARSIDAHDSDDIETVITAAFDLISEEDRKRLPNDVVDAYPLSMLQAGILFHMQLSPESRIYHDVHSTILEVDFDADAFIKAIETTLARHPVLRTSLSLADYSTPLQLVHRSAPANFVYRDIRHMSEIEQESCIDSWLREEKDSLFAFDSAPLIRFSVHQRTDTQIEFTGAVCHVVFDGWSENSTITELWDLHFQYASGESVCPKALPGTYRDFVALERSIISDTKYRTFWKQEIEGYEPAALPRWPQEYRSTELTPVCSPQQHVSEELTHHLTALSSDLKVPLQAVLLAAHIKVISMLMGSQRVCTGMVSHSRPDIEGGEAIKGLYLNTIPMVMDLGGHTWKSLVLHIYEKEQRLFPFRQYPMGQIKKDTGQEFLFESAFGYVHFHVMEELYRTGKLRRISETRRWAPTDFPLMSVFIHDPLEDRLSITLDFDAAELSPKQIESIGEYYFKTLATLTKNPDALCSSRCLLPHNEIQTIARLNPAIEVQATQYAVQNLFDQQVARTPDTVALIEGDTTTSYRVLQEDANQLANYLIQIGVKPGGKIGICLARSTRFVTAVLAVLKAGAIYVPLDLDYPPDRLAFMSEDSETLVVLSDNLSHAHLPDGIARLILLDETSGDIAACDDTSPDITITVDHPAYIMYTSGSTGVPKGILIPHKAIVRLVINPDYVSLDATETILMLAPVSFDASTFELWGSLLNGGQLAIMTDNLSSLEQIGRAIHGHCVTTMFLTSGLFHQLADEDLQALAPLKQLLFGGEVMSVPHVGKIMQAHPDCTLIHCYGPTENTTFSSCYTVKEEDLAHQPLPIGRPINGTQMVIVGPDLHLCPIGVAGELCLGGVGLAMGYLNRPTLTAEQFIPDPFSAVPGARLYRSGDLARILPSGLIEFVGRIDHQVKIRGFRIELAEIEVELTRHAQVREAVVLARLDTPGSKRLAAYVVAEPNTTLTSEILKQFLTKTLPSYMIPLAFVVLDELPLTANGKVDRDVLPAPAWGRISAAAEFVAPSTERENIIARLWQEVLGGEAPGVTDNFFENGGDSLSATRLISRIRRACDVELPLRVLFDTPTIREVATAVNDEDDREEFEI